MRNIFTKEDIKSSEIEKKLESAAKKYSNKLIQFESIKVLKKGQFKGINQTIPYAKVEVEISNLPIKNMVGIVGVAELEDGKNLIVLSLFSCIKQSKYTKVMFHLLSKK